MTDTKKPTNQEGDDALVLELDEGDQSWDHAVEGWGDSLDEVVLEPPEPAATTDGQTSETGNAGPQEAGEKEVSNTEKDDDPLLDLSDAEEQDALEQTSLSVAPGASSRPPPPLPSKIPSPPSLLAPPSAQTKRD